MKHSQPHITLYLEVIFLSWGGRILRKFESLMIILLTVYLSSLFPPFSGALVMILSSPFTDTYTNNFGTFFKCDINEDIKTIIFYWILHNLRMV